MITFQRLQNLYILLHCNICWLCKKEGAPKVDQVENEDHTFFFGNNMRVSKSRESV